MIICHPHTHTPHTHIPHTHTPHTHSTHTQVDTKPDIVSVKPLYLEEEPGCSREAELKAQSTKPIRLSSIIIAEEIGEKWLTYFKTKTPVCQTNVLKIIIMTNKRPVGTNGSLGTRLIRVSLGIFQHWSNCIC